MAALIGYLILAALASLVIVSIGAIFWRPNPILLVTTVVALGAFAWLSVEAQAELNQCRKLVDEYRPPPGQQGPDFQLMGLTNNVAVSRKLFWAFLVSGLLAVAGLVAQSVRFILARRTPPKSEIGNP